MDHTFTFTDDQLHWLRVALENSLNSAEILIQHVANDDDDVMDGLELVGRYKELQQIIGETDTLDARG